MFFQNCTGGFKPAQPLELVSKAAIGPNEPDPQPIDPIPTCSPVSALAFPGALGFGKATIGGRGGRVLRVTNLNNSGPGSLRWALQDSSGPRIVVISVEGRVRLMSEIRIANPWITVAGQSAPGQGLVISGARIKVEADQVILRGLKLRAGDELEGDIPRNRDNISIGGSRGNVVRNVVVDHNSCTWSIDESLSVWGTVQNTTISNNIIAQSLEDSIHIDEGKTTPAPHSTGMAVGRGELDPSSRKLSIVRNLFTSNRFRNAYIKDAFEVEFINNYVFNYGAGHQGLYLSGGFGPMSAAVIGNYYQDGVDTPNDERPAFDLRHLSTGSTVYLKDNFIEGHLEGAAPQIQGAHGKLEFVTRQPAFVGSNSEVLGRMQVPESVLNNAGARTLVGGLDIVDNRVINEVKTETIQIIDSQSEVGGFGNYAFGNATVVDTDSDGIPDWFEQQYADKGFKVNVADDKLDYDQDGYTNIEEYLNGLITGYSLDGCP